MRDEGGKSILGSVHHTKTHVNTAGTLGQGLGTKGTENPKATGAEPSSFECGDLGEVDDSSRSTTLKIHPR